jgi:2'-hydroxybiphenyl-2-sulfinate desulfinase
MASKEFRYTICPVGNASYIAANKDIFLQEAFTRKGIQPVRLQTLAEENWHVHFDYQDDALFREGGNIPPIWAKSGGAGVVLIGLSFIPAKSYIFVRVDAPIDSVEQLRGKRLGIPVRPEVKVVDFYKATVQRGFLTALAARGVAPGEVQFVELPSTEAEIAVKADKSSNLGKKLIEALDSGKIDALYSGGAGAQRLIATGNYKAIYELSARPELVSPIDNIYPNTLTVSKKLADEEPEIVVEYVKQVLLAAEWAKTHLPETLELFSKQVHGTIGEVTASLPVNFHKRLAPVLSQEGLFALESQKRFLYDQGYITHDFDIESWADHSFLKAAQAEIEAGSEKEELKNAG